MVKPKETCKNGYATKEFHKACRNEESYIHEHLSTLNFIARAFNCQNVLEIGTGDGDSTLALASAMHQTGGIVTTIDIEYKGVTMDRIMDEGLGHKVNFIIGDSIKNCPIGFYDLILIDGDHNQDKVEKEIKSLRHSLQDGGFMIFHDTNNPKWKKLRNPIITFLQTFCENNWDFYEWFNCNGLIVLRKPE